MIEFKVKSTGDVLDIAPDAKFQIEYENPMFADDRCPVAFSTEITFLPTAKNKRIFGYLAAMSLLPANREIDIDICVGGVNIMGGLLRFSSLKNEDINYTFIGKSIEDTWNGKIFEKQIHYISGENRYQDIRAVKFGEVDGVYAPILINATETDKISVAFPGITEEEKVDCDYLVKYHNHPAHVLHATPGSQFSYGVFTPAVSVMKILSDKMQNISIQSGTISELLQTTVVLAQYKTDCTQASSGIPDEGLDVGRMLPDVTELELLRVILKMFCCVLFRDADVFVMKNAGDIISSTSGILDWDDKVSREREVSERPSGGYKFAYANGEDEECSTGEEPLTIDSFREIITGQEDEIYRVFKHSGNGYIVSARNARLKHSDRWEEDVLLADLLTAGIEIYDLKPTSDEGEVYDNSVEAKLARAIPDKPMPGTNGYLETGSYWQMAAVVNPETVGDERGSEIIIGKINGGALEHQIGDGAVYYTDDAEQLGAFSKRLSAEALFNNYHQGFAQWCTGAHNIVSAEVNLSMTDIATFRMWRKVAFSGKTWLIKKMTMTFYASNGRCDTSAEFVSVD